jgi:threonylcarbamoyladenosine tRNA methylthiotransferase MtaB
MKVAFYTLGCKVNQYESEEMMAAFQKRGFEIADFDAAADVFVINTCTVTNTGDQKSRQMIHKARQKNKNAIIAVVGCYPQTNPGAVAGIEGVDIVMGTANRLSLPQRVEEILSFQKGEKKIVEISDIRKETKFEERILDDFTSRTRANVKIEDGCESFCSYCIIPYARGPVRSKEPELVIREAGNFLKKGFREIVITGIHLASYGKDLKDASLLSLLQTLSALPYDFRIRLGSLEPRLFTPDFTEKIAALQKLCPHFHISLQSGCDETLRRMNRKYTSEEYKRSVTFLREKLPGAAVTTDVMVGFPGETAEEFEASLAFVKEIGFARGHVFAYSKRTGTRAAEMENQVGRKEKFLRSHRMIEALSESEDGFLQRHIGQTLPVLFERKASDGAWEGFSPEYITVRVQSERDLSHALCPVRIETVREKTAYGAL